MNPAISPACALASSDSVEARQRLRERIKAGLNSGPGRPLTVQRVARLKEQALGQRGPEANSRPCTSNDHRDAEGAV